MIQPTPISGKASNTTRSGLVLAVMMPILVRQTGTYLTAPAVRPLTKRFWSRKNIKARGIVVTTDAAAM